MLRSDILDEAKELITGDRQKAYGSAYENFKKIAHLWSEYLDTGISVQDVANLMILLKVARSTGPEQKDDNYIDICGYAALAGELIAGSKDEAIYPSMPINKENIDDGGISDFIQKIIDDQLDNV